MNLENNLMEEQTPDIMFQMGHINSLDKTIKEESELDKYYKEFYKPEPVLYKIEHFLSNSIYYLSLGMWDTRRA